MIGSRHLYLGPHPIHDPVSLLLRLFLKLNCTIPTLGARQRPSTFRMRGSAVMVASPSTSMLGHSRILRMNRAAAYPMAGHMGDGSPNCSWSLSHRSPLQQPLHLAHFHCHWVSAAVQRTICNGCVWERTEQHSSGPQESQHGLQAALRSLELRQPATGTGGV